MPFLTRELPPGGRHIARIAMPVAPTPAASVRVRQLLPVGLLVAASSTGAALTVAIGGATTADRQHDTALTTLAVGSLPGGEVADAADAAGASRRTVSRSELDRASYVLPHVGTHRATGTVAQGTPAAPAAPATTGGKHRAGIGTALAGSAPQSGGKHAATSAATPAETSATPTSPAPTSTAPSTTAPASAAPAATSAPAQPGVVTGLVDGMVGTVGGLLGGG